MFELLSWSIFFCKFSAFSLKFKKLFLITRTIFSHSRSEQFWKQNTNSKNRLEKGEGRKYRSSRPPSSLLCHPTQLCTCIMTHSPSCWSRDYANTLSFRPWSTNKYLPTSSKYVETTSLFLAKMAKCSTSPGRVVSKNLELISKDHFTRFSQLFADFVSLEIQAFFHSFWHFSTTFHKLQAVVSHRHINIWTEKLMIW